MTSKLIDALKLTMQPVAVLLANDEPEEGLHFKEGAAFGCVFSMMVAASKKNRIAYFDRKSFGCPGGGVGLGFGDCYGQFPIQDLLSTGNEEMAAMMGSQGAIMAEGERFYKTPGRAQKWVESLPMTDVPAEYVAFKPWNLLTEEDEPELLIFFVNADQLSALVVMSDYDDGSNHSVTAPFGAACQSILYGYAEAQKDRPRGVIGLFDISQRAVVDRETLSFTVPFKMYQDMEASVDGSFLQTHAWEKLQGRQG